MPLTDEHILEVITGAALAAGDKALESYGAIATTLKYDGSVVTAADKAAEDDLRRVIEANFPGHRVFGEEGGGEEDICRGPVWLIDPIDGTNNFVHALPTWGVSAGLIRDGRPALGVIYYPVLRETYRAIAGQGAWCNGVRLHADDSAEPDRNAIFGVTSDVWKNFQVCVPIKVRALGSAAACCTYTAAGRFLASFMNDWKSWDIGAGLCIALEAGCVAYDIQGRQVTDFANFKASGPQPPLLLSGPNVWEGLLDCFIAKS